MSHSFKINSSTNDRELQPSYNHSYAFILLVDYLVGIANHLFAAMSPIDRQDLELDRKDMNKPKITPAFFIDALGYRLWRGESLLDYCSNQNNRGTVCT